MDPGTFNWHSEVPTPRDSSDVEIFNEAIALKYKDTIDQCTRARTTSIPNLTTAAPSQSFFLLTEAQLRLARYYARFPEDCKLLAGETFSQAYTSSNQLPEKDKLKTRTSIATWYGSMGMKRKQAFYLSLAATSAINSEQSEVALGAIEDAILLLLAHFCKWTKIIILLVWRAIDICHSLKRHDDLVRHAFYLLSNCSMDLSLKEQQMTFSILENAPTSCVVQYCQTHSMDTKTLLPILQMITAQSLVNMRSVLRCSTPLTMMQHNSSVLPDQKWKPNHEVFIYRPPDVVEFQENADQPVLWVQYESAFFSVQLRNPYLIPLDISSLFVSIPNVKVFSHPLQLTLLPEESKNVILSTTPLTHGEVHLFHLNVVVSSHISFTVPIDCHQITVLPPMPLLYLASPKLYDLSLTVGDETTIHINIWNLSTVPVMQLELHCAEDIVDDDKMAVFREDLPSFSWNADLVQSALPIQPNQQVVLPIIIKSRPRSRRGVLTIKYGESHIRQLEIVLNVVNRPRIIPTITALSSCQRHFSFFKHMFHQLSPKQLAQVAIQYCVVTLQFENQEKTPSTLQYSFLAESTSHHETLSLQPGESKSVLLPLKRQTLHQMLVTMNIAAMPLETEQSTMMLTRFLLRYLTENIQLSLELDLVSMLLGWEKTFYDALLTSDVDLVVIHDVKDTLHHFHAFLQYSVSTTLPAQLTFLIDNDSSSLVYLSTRHFIIAPQSTHALHEFEFKVYIPPTLAHYDLVALLNGQEIFRDSL